MRIVVFGIVDRRTHAIDNCTAMVFKCLEVDFIGRMVPMVPEIINHLSRDTNTRTSFPVHSTVKGIPSQNVIVVGGRMM